MVPKDERGVEEVCRHLEKHTEGKEMGMEMDVNMCVLEKCNVLCHR